MFVRPLHNLHYFQPTIANKKREENMNGDILDNNRLNNCQPAMIECVCCSKNEELAHLNGLNSSSLLRMYENKFTKCPNRKCDAFLHLLCLTKNTLRDNMAKYAQ